MTKVRFILLLLIFTYPIVSKGLQIEQKYKILYSPPGHDKNEYNKVELVQNSKNEFYMNVPSVYCLNKICKVDTVKLYWDSFGQYQHFQVRKTTRLEKSNKQSFNQQDYLKLDSILKNSNSVFKSLKINEIVSYSEEDIDARSGATQLIIDKSESVKGAVLTCYNLWHWANGNPVDTIRKVSARQCSRTKLLRLLSDPNPNHVNFAIDELFSRRDYHQNVLKTAQNNNFMKLKSTRKKWINYIENASDSVYRENVLSQIKPNEKGINSMLLQSLARHQNKLSKQFYCILLKHLSDFKSYQEIDLLLNQLEFSNLVDVRISTAIMQLLNRDDIIVSRRAYWFLSNQKLLPQQLKIVEKYARKYKDYL